MSKTLKRIILGAGITLGVLVVGAGVAYAFLSNTPKLERKVTVLEELLPRGAKSYLVVNLEKLAKVNPGSKFTRVAKKIGLAEDFSNQERLIKIKERTHLDPMHILGKRFIYSKYGKKEMLVITQPRWNVKMLWKTALSKGRRKDTGEIPYSVLDDGSSFAFAGDYLWFASSEKLLLEALDIAASKTRIEEQSFPEDGLTLAAYGLSRNPDKYLVYKELLWDLKQGDYGPEFVLEIDSPSGMIGRFIAGSQPARSYASIPDDAAAFISLSGLSPYNAWKEAQKLSVEEDKIDVLGNEETEKEFAALATDLGSDADFIVKGWNVDKWYSPLSWMLRIKSSAKTGESLEALTPWLFPTAWDTTMESGDLTYHHLDFGEDFAGMGWLLYDGSLLFTSDTAMIGWFSKKVSSGRTISSSSDFNSVASSVGIKNPVAWINWPEFRKVFVSYLMYAADRTQGITPADVQSKLEPLLEAMEFKAIVAGLDNDGEKLVITFRTAK